MSRYKTKIDYTEIDSVYKLSKNDTTESVRLLENEYLYGIEDVYWAKEKDSTIFYSDDNIYETEMEDATHIIFFIK